MKYMLMINNNEAGTFGNLPSILEYLRTETNGAPIYIDDTEMSVEDLVDEVTGAGIVKVECESLQDRGDDYLDMLIVEFDVDAASLDAVDAVE